VAHRTKGNLPRRSGRVGLSDEHEADSPKSVVIFGESLGGPIAANLAKDVSPGRWSRLDVYSVPDLASNFLLFLPCACSRVFTTRLREYMARVHVPTLVIHSRTDEIVPFSHAEASSGGRTSASNFSRFVAITTPPLLVSGNRLRRVCGAFLKRCLRTNDRPVLSGATAIAVAQASGSGRPFPVPKGGSAGEHALENAA